MDAAHGNNAYRHLVPACLMAIMLGCAGNSARNDYIDATYDCARGEVVQVRFYPGQERAVMTRGDATVSLPQLPTASGFHYTDGRTGLRGKGDEMNLEIGRMAPIPCTAR